MEIGELGSKWVVGRPIGIAALSSAAFEEAPINASQKGKPAMSPETKLDVSKADFAPGQRPPLSSANSLRDRLLICAALISLVTAVLISETPIAVAQDQTTSATSPPRPPPARNSDS
jgi:hypothetical protein